MDNEGIRKMYLQNSQQMPESKIKDTLNKLAKQAPAEEQKILFNDLYSQSKEIKEIVSSVNGENIDTGLCSKREVDYILNIKDKKIKELEYKIEQLQEQLYPIKRADRYEIFSQDDKIYLRNKNKNIKEVSFDTKVCLASDVGDIECDLIETKEIVRKLQGGIT